MKTAQEWIEFGKTDRQINDAVTYTEAVQRDALESAAEIADDSLLSHKQIAAGIRRLKPT